jgi:hypothetical protein
MSSKTFDQSRLFSKFSNNLHTPLRPRFRILSHFYHASLLNFNKVLKHDLLIAAGHQAEDPCIIASIN